MDCWEIGGYTALLLSMSPQPEVQWGEGLPSPPHQGPAAHCIPTCWELPAEPRQRDPCWWGKHRFWTSPAFLTKPLFTCSSLSLASSAELKELTATQQAQGLPRDPWGHVGDGQDLGTRWKRKVNAAKHRAGPTYLHACHFKFNFLCLLFNLMYSFDLSFSPFSCLPEFADTVEAWQAQTS